MTLRKIWICVCTILSITFFGPTFGSEQNTLLQQTLNVLEEGQNLINFGTDQDLILILGFGDGKSSVLNAFSNTSGTILSTSHLPASFYPELKVHAETGSKIVDLTGYQNTGNIDSSILEVTANVFTQLVFQSASSVKLVFVIHDTSLNSFLSNPLNVLTHFHHICTFINDLEKFSQSIGVVITTDEAFVDDAQQEFEIAMIKLKNHIQVPESNENFKIWNEITFLIDKLINGTQSIILYNNNITNLRNMILEEMIYTKVHQTDFTYTLSAHAKQLFKEIIVPYANHTVQTITSYIFSTTSQLTTHYQPSATDKDDIAIFQTRVLSRAAVFQPYNEIGIENIDKFILECRKTTNTYSEPIHTQLMKNIYNHKILSSILRLENNILLTNWTNALKQLTSYLIKLKVWYEFLAELQSSLASYNGHKRLLTNPAIYLHTSGSNLHEVLNALVTVKTFSLSIFNSEKLEYFMIQHFNKIIQYHTQNEVKTCDNGHFKYYGNYVILAKVKNSINSVCGTQKVLQVDIFAIDIVYIDSNLYLPSTHLTIIAPKWEVISNSILSVSGNNGVSFTHSKAAKGNKLTRAKGMNGLPGNPGGNSGSFFGSTQLIINGQYLKILANGGNGGAGQNGGDGVHFDNPADISVRFPHTKHWNAFFGGIRNHENFVDCNKDKGKSSLTVTVVWNNNVEVYNCQFSKYQEREIASYPGNGGMGGIGGLSGEIVVTRLQEFQLVNTIIQNGVVGTGGQGGVSGNSFKHEKQVFECRKSYKSSFPFYFKEEHITHKLTSRIKTSHSNFRGASNHNSIGRSSPYALPQRLDTNSKRSEYRKFIRDEILPTMNVTRKEEFLYFINN